MSQGRNNTHELRLRHALSRCVVRDHCRTQPMSTSRRNSQSQMTYPRSMTLLPKSFSMPLVVFLAKVDEVLRLLQIAGHNCSDVIRRPFRFMIPWLANASAHDQGSRHVPIRKTSKVRQTVSGCAGTKRESLSDALRYGQGERESKLGLGGWNSGQRPS